MEYNPDEVFRAAASLAACGMKIVKLYGVRDDLTCTCGRGAACGDSAGKHPAGGEGWQHRATDDEHEIASWFEGCNANIRWNIGVRLGRSSGIIDVEADTPEAVEVMRRYGLDKVDTTAFQGSRGPHLLFQFSDDLPDAAVIHIDGLEVRIGGGQKASQSVFPTSWHRTGVQYSWLPGRSPDDIKPAKLPDAFKAAVLEAAKGKRSSGAVAHAKDLLAQEEKIRAGGRHAYLIGIASWLSFQCRDYSDDDRARVLSVLRAVNEWQCEPPKDFEEVRKIANDQFDHYRDRRIERIARRPYERHGLEWDADSREYFPGSWRLTIVHSDPVHYRLRIPGEPGAPAWKVNLELRQFQQAREVALAVSAVATRINLLDPNSARWNAIWCGEQIENEDGDRRQVRGLSAKLIDEAEDEYPPAELKQYAYTASALLNYLRRFEGGDDSGADEAPNESGVPKWIGGEMFLKWGETWDAVRRKHDSLTPKDIRDLRSRILTEIREKEFSDRLVTIGGVRSRWLVWGPRHLKALEKLACG